MNTPNKAARRSCNFKRAYRPLVRVDAHSIARERAEHERYENFNRGSMYAAIALCAMFAFLSFGAVVFGW